MRTWNLLSAVGAALIGAWVTVASLAQAAEFTCKVPWHSDTDCNIPKFTIHAQETLTIKVTSVKVDGADLGTPFPVFTILDVNNNATLGTLTVPARTSASYKNERTETDQTVQIRVNIGKMNDVDIQGSYTVSK